MADTFVTNVSDPALWTSLKASWESQGKPGWVMRGHDTYEVFQPAVPEGEVSLRFRYRTDQSMYEDCSFQHK